MRSRSVRSTATLVLALGGTFTFTYLAVRDVDVDAFWRALRDVQYFWLVPSLLVLAAAVYIRAFRWGLLFTRPNRPPQRALLNALLLGYFFNQILPARAGEAVRVIALHQEAGTSRAEAVGTAVAERVYDLVALMLLLFAAAPFLPEVTWLRRVAVFAAGFVAVLVIGIVVVGRYRERPLRVLLRPLAALPRVSTERTDAAAVNLVRGLGALHRPGSVVPVLVVTVASWLVAAASYWLVVVGFDLGLGFGAALLILVAVNLAAVLPSLPAAVGVFEAATLLALDVFGIDPSTALSIAVVLHGVNFLPFIAAGLVVLHHHAFALRQRS